MAKAGSKIVGVLPMIAVKPPLISAQLVSLPYCDAGGPLADTPAIEAALIREGLFQAKTFHSKTLVIRSTRNFAGLPDSQTANIGKVRMVLALPDSSEKLMASFKAKVRSQVKKAFKNKLTWKIGSLELLDEFYAVFSENMRDLGSPVHSRNWIKSILRSYKNRAQVGVIKTSDGQTAAAGIILCHPRIVSIPWASSLKRYNRYNPNMLLYWAFLKYAADNGYSYFDFGRSTPDQGTYRFKKQWGAIPETLHWSSFCKTKTFDEPLKPAPEVDSGKIGKPRMIVQHMIERMPITVSKAFGSQTRKYISL